MSLSKDKPPGPGDSPALRLLQGLAQQPLPELQQGVAPTRLSLAPGACLFEAGVPQPYVYVVGSGLLKLSYLLPDGDEWVKSFSCEGMFFGSLAALEPGGLSSFSVSAIEASELERIDYRALEALAARHPAWLQVLYRAMRALAALKEARERDLLVLAPAQRYAAFVRQQPGLAERVPLKDLARHLGITPVSLSRIRARLRVRAC